MKLKKQWIERIDNTSHLILYHLIISVTIYMWEFSFPLEIMFYFHANHFTQCFCNVCSTEDIKKYEMLKMPTKLIFSAFWHNM